MEPTLALDETGRVFMWKKEHIEGFTVSFFLKRCNGLTDVWQTIPRDLESDWTVKKTNLIMA